MRLVRDEIYHHNSSDNAIYERFGLDGWMPFWVMTNNAGFPKEYMREVLILWGVI